MFALALTAAIAAGPCQVITNEPRIKFLEGEIARAKAHLRTLEKQLAQLKPPPKAKDKPAPRAKLKFDTLSPDSMEIGKTGFFKTVTYNIRGNTSLGSQWEAFEFRIVKLLGPEDMLVRLSLRTPAFVVSGMPTGKHVEDQRLRLPGVWEVKTTRKVGDKSHFVVVQTRHSEDEVIETVPPKPKD